MATAEPFTLRFAEHFNQVAIHIPRSIIDPHLPVGDVVAQTLPPSPLTDLAINYATIAESVPAEGQAATHLARHLVETIGAALTLTEKGHHSPARRALLYEAINAIATRLHDPELDPASVATQLSVSPRTLHNVFTDHHLTFSAEVLHQRLTRAKQLLVDPARRHLRIVDVAAECGFTDRSHFHRTFRTAAGQTPARYRNMHS